MGFICHFDALIPIDEGGDYQSDGHRICRLMGWSVPRFLQQYHRPIE